MFEDFLVVTSEFCRWKRCKFGVWPRQSFEFRRTLQSLAQRLGDAAANAPAAFRWVTISTYFNNLWLFDNYNWLYNL